MSALLAEFVVLLSTFRSDHRSRRRRGKNPTWPQILPERSAAPLLSTGISPHHGLRPGKLVLLHLDYSRSLASTFSRRHRRRRGLRSGWRWSTLKGTGEKESLPERGRKNNAPDCCTGSVLQGLAHERGLLELGLQGGQILNL
jgi:hypothetical protein